MVFIDNTFTDKFVKRFFIVNLLGLIFAWLLHHLYNYGYYSFVFFFTLNFLLFSPKIAFSPASILFAYYGAWFIVSPSFASRYEGKLLIFEYSLSSVMAYTIFCTGLISIYSGIDFGTKTKKFKMFTGLNVSKEYQYRLIAYLFLISTLLIFLIVITTGGFTLWLYAPGDAFLNRGGSGIYIVLSHFSSILLAAIVGFVSYKYKKYFLLLIFLLWVLITSPVHGSKMQISLLVIISFLPFLRFVKLFSLKSFLLYICLLLVFILGLYYRNVSWISLDKLIPYSLNYFSTLDNLATSVRDFSPSLLTTFFLPFEKFKTPIGLSRPDLYFDMNHLLTDIYLPTAWKIRATEQWPVETDLYLNFMFFGGLPLVALYLGFVGFFYGMALKHNNLGNWLISFLMTAFIVSHLRGSLYNHLDFYMYPYMLFVWFLLYNMDLDQSESNSLNSR